jgi:hypothetical protein
VPGAPASVPPTGQRVLGAPTEGRATIVPLADAMNFSTPAREQLRCRCVTVAPAA